MSERIVIDANGNKYITNEPLLHKKERYEPMHPEIKKMYEDYFEKCFRESSLARRPWVGLTDEERRGLWRVIIGWGDPSHDDEDLMKAIEDALRRKNAA